MASLPYLRSTVRPFGTSISTVYGSMARFTAPSFSTSARRQALKETDRNRDDLPNKYEEEKNENLKKVKEGKAYWHEQLASESEADVKADRGEASIPGEEDFLAKNMATGMGMGAKRTQGTQGTQQGKK